MNYQTTPSQAPTHPHPPKQKEKKRSAAFDGLKGFFILAIITYYYFQHLLPGGFLAVNGFLVVGGYLTFRHNIKTFAEDYKERFPVRSLKRMFFPMLFMIVVTVAFLLVCIPVCTAVNRGLFTSKTDEETQLPQNAGVCLSRVLNARFSSRNGSTLLV